ncbi:MAG: glycosyltransferase family 4 protein [Thermoanaerobaculia bacterium]|nr:glycosyltransferase family 4 protein [Thermoanaerobaculia bacterium]
MRIVFLVTRSGPIGGAQIHVRDLATVLREQGHEIVVLAGGSGPLFDQMDSRGVETRRLHFLDSRIRPWKEGRAWREISRHLCDLRPDLLSTHSSKAGVLGRLAARRMSFPTLHTAHGWAFASTKPWHERRLFQWLERLVAPLSDAIIAVSDHDRAEAVRVRIRPRLGVTTVLNGVADGPAEWRAKPEVSPVRIAMVARWSGQKDYQTFLAGLARLRDRTWSAEVIGSGTRGEPLRTLAEQEGLADRIEFSGECHDVAERLARAQIFVLSTHFEGLPRAILEAMRAGLPVVASRVGGVAEEVVDGETGRLVPPRSPLALAEALEPLLADRELRTQMGLAGRRRYEKMFRLERMVAETERVYRRLLQNRETVA